MLVSHRKRFIYTKTLKTAGTSVESYFEPYCMPENAWAFAHERDEYVGETGIVGYRGPDPTGKTWFNHMSAEVIRRQLGPARWAAYFKFCVIRDPFDKLVSAFHFFEQEGAALRGLSGLRLRIRRWIRDRRYPTTEERFRAWVREGGSVDDRDTYTIQGEICVDYAIRYEDLTAGVQHVCEVLELAFEPARLPRLKTGIRPAGLALRDYYDARTVALVAERYGFEFKHFGYAATVS
jgi:hypothetical protein